MARNLRSMYNSNILDLRYRSSLSIHNVLSCFLAVSLSPRLLLYVPSQKLAYWPTARSCFRVLAWHLGTVAIASLIIAVVKFIRYWILYTEKVSTMQRLLLVCCVTRV